MPDTIEKRVANGARWLDESFPGWEERIDPNTLCLVSTSSCICGQLFADRLNQGEPAFNGFRWASQNLFSEANGWISELIAMKATPFWMPGGHDRAQRVAQALGFDAEEHQHDREYDLLEGAWKRLLARRAAKQLVNA